MTRCGLEQIVFNQHMPFWCGVGVKSPSPASR
jgi:hypothetical protein